MLPFDFDKLIQILLCCSASQSDSLHVPLDIHNGLTSAINSFMHNVEKWPSIL